MDSWIFILLNVLQSVIDIYFDAQVVPNLTIGIDLSLATRDSHTAPFIPSSSSDTGLIILIKSAE